MGAKLTTCSMKMLRWSKFPSSVQWCHKLVITGILILPMQHFCVWCFGDILKRNSLLFCWFSQIAVVVIVFEESTLKSANINLLESKFNTQT